MELSERKSQINILQRHQSEDQREIERLREKAEKYEDDNTQKQSTIDTLSRDNHDKVIDNSIRFLQSHSFDLVSMDR